MRKHHPLLVLAAGLAIAPAAARAVPVVVALDAPAKSLVRLVFTPSGPALHGALPAARSIEAAAPGEVPVELPAGSRWSLAAQARGLWSRPELFEAAAGGRVTVRLLPGGTIHANIEVAPGETLPSELSLRLEPSPGGPASQTARPAFEVCPVSDRRMACPAPAGTLDLRLRARGFVSQYRWGMAVPANGDLDLGKVPLRRGASVVGTVAAPARDFRFQDCRVELTPRITTLPRESEQARNGEKAEAARVNARGFFELAGIAPGTYRLTVRHPKYAPAVVAPVEVATGAETEVKRIDLHLPVALEVRLSPTTDAFLRRWTVHLLREGEVLGYSALVAEGAADAAGSWKRTGLESGEYTVEVTDSRGARWAAQRLTLGAESAAIDLEVPFQRVRGTVTLGSEPLAATLEFGGAHGELRIPARSDAKGRYYAFLPWSKSWDVDVTSEGDPHVVSHLKGLEIAALAHAPGVLDIALPDTRLPVEVVDERGQPGTHASLRAVREGDRKAVAERIANLEGKIELRGLAPGVWHLEADGTDAAGNRESADAVKVDLEEKQEHPETVRLVLRRGWKLSGEVVSPAGSGVFGAEILATLEPETPFAHLEIPTAHTGPRRHLHLEHSGERQRRAADGARGGLRPAAAPPAGPRRRSADHLGRSRRRDARRRRRRAARGVRRARRGTDARRPLPAAAPARLLLGPPER